MYRVQGEARRKEVRPTGRYSQWNMPGARTANFVHSDVNCICIFN